MIMKRIHGTTLQGALAKARQECGPDTVLVETRRTSDGYVLVAARPDPKPKTVPATPPALGWTRGFAPVAAAAERFGLSAAVLRALENALLGTRVSLARAGDPAVPGVAAKVLQALIPTTSLRTQVTAFVGPTGVGKTTTLAKLAAEAIRDRGESVAILTVDTWRVAAVEQLRAFADMLSVPCEVAFTPLDLARLVREHASCDRILIDTSGRSPFDRSALHALAGTLEPSRATVALCVPAGLRRADAEATLDAFATLNPACAVLTKWDETKVPGEVLSLLIEKGLPLSHVTIGQRVPEDILVADAQALAAEALDLPHPVPAT